SEPLEASFALDGGPSAFAQVGLVQSGDEAAHVRPRLAGLDAVEPQPPIGLCLDVDLLVAEVDHRGVEDVSGDEVDVPSARVLTGAFEAGRKHLQVDSDVEARARLPAHDGEQTLGELAVTGEGRRWTTASAGVWARARCRSSAITIPAPICCRPASRSWPKTASRNRSASPAPVAAVTSTLSKLGASAINGARLRSGPGSGGT